jgi:beta-glucosidase
MQGRTYRYYAGTPVYPFGAGLSYTTFSYAPLRIEPVSGSPENGIVVTTDVANTGKRDGDEVAQLYLTPPAFDGAPRLALRGFQRVSLKAGERKQVSFTLSPRDLSFVTRDGVRQLTPGQYRLSVGSGQPGTGVAQQDGTVTLKQAIVLAQ